MSGVFVSSNIIVIRTIQSRSLECILFKNEMTTTRTKDTTIPTTAENKSGGERESERKKDETQHIMYVEIDNCVLLSYNYITVVWSCVVAACAVLLLEWFRLVFASHTHTQTHRWPPALWQMPFRFSVERYCCHWLPLLWLLLLFLLLYKIMGRKRFINFENWIHSSSKMVWFLS